MFDVANLENENHLSPYRRSLLEALRPVLEKVDLEKLDTESKVEIRKEKDDWTLQVKIIPADSYIPPLSLFASRHRCSLVFAEAEQIECNIDPEGVWDEHLVGMILEAAEKYLNGTTILEHYNKNGKLIKKEYFFGITSEPHKDCRIGTSIYPFVFPRKVSSIKKRTFRFLR